MISITKDVTFRDSVFRALTITFVTCAAFTLRGINPINGSIVDFPFLATGGALV